ncbi:hypothetical protein [Trinickia symbiotica]|uniref:Uncharacterized protein n=1 Tax=Trinickia symbiotica TaxID=863227 RepID=A0A2N7XA26_9BURK|nr:hypothetical protein [Trinickia symbiotica]PMS38484.1 hypothetical protein C0Z20_00955 [Trinickia symbiotica]
MSQSAAFLDIGYTPENDEDVCHVPGSIGTAGPTVTPWAPRATPASDRARAEAMAVLGPFLSKHRRPAPSRAPAAPADFWKARENYLKRKS